MSSPAQRLEAALRAEDIPDETWLLEGYSAWDVVLKWHEDEVSTLLKRISELTDAVRAYRHAYPHQAPGDCFATGPLTGNPIEDLVVCPGCVAEKLALSVLGMKASHAQD